MGQTRLNYLSLMNIEHEMLDSIDTSVLIKEFAHLKAEK